MITIDFRKESAESAREVPDKSSFYPWNIEGLEQINCVPEIHCGFEPDYKLNTPYIFAICEDQLGVFTEYEGKGDVPLSYEINVEPGNYLVDVEIVSQHDVEDAIVFLGRRRLAWRGSLTAYQKVVIHGIENVCPIIPRYHESVVQDASLNVTVLGKDVHLSTICYDKAEVRTIYIAGDSTVTDQCGVYPYLPEWNYCGWGQMLSAFTKTDFAVSNHAHSGLTTKSFREEGHYGIVLEQLRKNDLCLIQFGHNDQKLDDLQADYGYRENLEKYVEEIKDKGAVPILVTPLARNTWKDAEYNDLLDAYARVCMEVGKKHNVQVIPLHEMSMEFIQNMGKEKTKNWFYPSDYTHTNDFGAYCFAKAVYMNLTGNTVDEFWPVPEVKRETYIPQCYLESEKNEIHEKKIIDRPNDKVKRYEALELVTSALKYFPINVYNDVFEDIIGHETFAGTVQCAYQNGVLPDYILKRKKLEPLEFISGREFLDYIEVGLRGRTDSIFIVPETMKKVISQNYKINREEAIELLQLIKI